MRSVKCLLLSAVLAAGSGCVEDDGEGWDAAEQHQTACHEDLSRGAIVMLSGGGFDAMNPPEVRARMDEYVAAVNADPYVNQCSMGKGLAFKFLKGQKTAHIHQTQWRKLCEVLVANEASPIVIAGHSNGGAAAVSLSRCLKNKGRSVDLLITADSVPTIDDLGNVYTVPDNVGVNVNTFVIPNAVTFLVPFPIGRANKRGAGDTQPTINIGLDYLLPGAVAHRNAFYDFAGGDELDDGSLSRPFILLDMTLAVLERTDDPTALALEQAEELAEAAGIRVTFEGPGTKVEIPRP